MTTEVVIVGAGMAGCSIAAHVSRFASVAVLEAGSQVAMEGAAQNAGLIRRLDPEPCDRALAQRTYDFLSSRRSDLSQVTGAVLGMVRDPLTLNDACAHLRARGIAVEQAHPSDFPLLDGSPLSGAWYLPDERVTSGPQLAQALLEEAELNGASIHTRRTVSKLLIENGRCTGVQTPTGDVHADLTIIAAGAWSGILAAQAGLNRPLIPLRRMAAITPFLKDEDWRHPWCWLDDVGLYAKPDKDGWLVSPCDEQPEPQALGRPSTGSPSEQQWTLLKDKISTFLPRLTNRPMTRSWTGLRTFSPDRKPMLGADGECDDLYWAAGLGGSGLSTCIGVGEALASWLQGKATPWLNPSGVAPDRPQLHRWPIYPSGDPRFAKLISSDLVFTL